MLVNTLPEHGLPYLIRQQAKVLSEQGVVVLRIRSALKPPECALPSCGQMLVRIQSFPSYPTIVSTDMSGPDISGLETMGMRDVLPGWKSKMMTL